MGVNPSPQVLRRIKENASKGDRLNPIYERICKFFAADHWIKQAYAWDLTLAIDEGKWEKARVLRDILQMLKGKKLADP